MGTPFPSTYSSSCSSLEGLDPAERDAALTMCMIGGGREGSPGIYTTLSLPPRVCLSLSTAGTMYAVCHDHSYAKRPPRAFTPSSRG